MSALQEGQEPEGERTWDEFRKSGMLWWTNMILQTFGWCITVEVDKDNREKVLRAYPERVKFRGFPERANTEGYIAVSDYMKANAKQLADEARD
ncbi:hypothetical protein MKY95_23230 [Paenibacillus sp. FSL P4-0176]|uniref:hypothetical protein n=1 Tax=Paenibacillus sp. FSL P4-0176 TaxID=2921631 RepID=UPI0030CF5EA6